MPDTKLRLSPNFAPNRFGNLVAARLDIVDAEITTDSAGGFQSDSLRPGDYRVSFPDHPDWPAIIVRAERIREGELSLRLLWDER